MFLRLSVPTYSTREQTARSIRRLLTRLRKRHLKRARIVRNQPQRHEHSASEHDRQKHPVLPAHQAQHPLMFRAITDEPRVRIEGLASNGQFHSRSFLHITNPLPILICSSNKHPLAIHNEPDRHVVWLAGLAAEVSKNQGVTVCGALESGYCKRVHNIYGSFTSSA